MKSLKKARNLIKKLIKEQNVTYQNPQSPGTYLAPSNCADKTFIGIFDNMSATMFDQLQQDDATITNIVTNTIGEDDPKNYFLGFPLQPSQIEEDTCYMQPEPGTYYQNRPVVYDYIEGIWLKFKVSNVANFPTMYELGTNFSDFQTGQLSANPDTFLGPISAIGMGIGGLVNMFGNVLGWTNVEGGQPIDDEFIDGSPTFGADDYVPNVRILHYDEASGTIIYIHPDFDNNSTSLDINRYWGIGGTGPDDWSTLVADLANNIYMVNPEVENFNQYGSGEVGLNFQWDPDANSWEEGWTAPGVPLSQIPFSEGGTVSNMNPAQFINLLTNAMNGVSDVRFEIRASVTGWGDAPGCTGCLGVSPVRPPHKKGSGLGDEDTEADRIDPITYVRPDQVPVDTFGDPVSVARPTGDPVSLIGDSPSCDPLIAQAEAQGEAFIGPFCGMCNNEEWWCNTGNNPLPEAAYGQFRFKCENCGICDPFTPPQCPSPQDWGSDVDCTGMGQLCDSGLCDDAEMLLGYPDIYNACLNCCFEGNEQAFQQSGAAQMSETVLKKIKRGIKKYINEQKTLSEQTTTDCNVFASLITDTTVTDLICDAQCAGNLNVGNNIVLQNIANCCPQLVPDYCPQDEPALGTEDPCRRLMDDIIPNQEGVSGQEFCKKRCKEGTIVMMNTPMGQIDACKCCSTISESRFKNKLKTQRIKEALKRYKEKKRLQELGGIKKTGCLAENLDSDDPINKEMAQSLKTFVDAINKGLNERETDIPTELCLKNVEIEGNSGTATACNSSCKGPLCSGCDCYKVGISTLDPSDKGRMDETEENPGTCIKNVKQSGLFGQHLSFDVCGKCPCGDDCTCITPKRD